MKSKKSIYSLVSVFLILVVSFILSSCESTRVSPDVGRPNPPAPAAVPLVLQGVVVDNITGAGIAGATVTVKGTSLSTTTNVQGAFTFSDLTLINTGTVVLNASDWPNYGYGSGSAYVDKSTNGANYAVIPLYKIVTGPTVTITPAVGGAANTNSTESAGPSTALLTVPPSVITQTNQISVAFLPTNATPPNNPSSTGNKIDISTVVINPANAAFTAPGATLAFPLPYKINVGALLEVWNIVNGTFQSANISAVVDPTGLVAKAYVTSGGTYCLFDQVGINKSSNVHGTTITLSKNSDGELDFRLGSGTQSVNLPNLVNNSQVITPTGYAVSQQWIYDELKKQFQITNTGLGIFAGSDPVVLSFPGFSLHPTYVDVNGNEVNPAFPNQAGNWYYDWFFIQQSTTTQYTLSALEVTVVYTQAKTIYVQESGTNKTGWYWVAHSQGGIGSYYGL